MRALFRFPNPVNEDAARVVALGVVVLAGATVVTHRHWLLVPLAYGFLARVLAGPTFSPLGLVATRLVVPRLGRPVRPVPGPPKRFAQAIGLSFSGAALLLAAVLHEERAADVLLLGLVGAAGLEAFLNYCLGCRIFALGMRLGVVPTSVCRACDDIRPRLQPS